MLYAGFTSIYAKAGNRMTTPELHDDDELSNTTLHNQWCTLNYLNKAIYIHLHLTEKQESRGEGIQSQPSHTKQTPLTSSYREDGGTFSRGMHGGSMTGNEHQLLQGHINLDIRTICCEKN